MHNIAVIGAGYWGKNLVRNFYELGVLSLVCDKDEEKILICKEKYPKIKLTTSFQDVLKDETIKAVAIGAPAVEHYPLVREALKMDKDVFVEKPLALKVEEGEELVRLAEERKKILMVGHILQYHFAVIKLKEMINQGELGKIQYIYSNRLNIGKIRTEENILWSFAPHDISVILMFLDEFPEFVYATGGSYVQPKIVDVTITTMGFKSGVKAHIFVSWLHPFKEQKLVVVGDKKMAVFDDLTKEKLFLYPYKIEWKDRIPVATKVEPEIVPLSNDEEPLKMECQHFLECIEKRSQPKSDGKEGLRVLKILQACEDSLSKNGMTITLDERKKEKGYFIHPSSYVDENVQIGQGTSIWHFSHILEGSKIGKNCKIGQNVVIGPRVNIGNGCKIQNNVSVYEGVTLEDEVFCGPSMVFTNVINPRSAISRMKELKTTLVKKGATIGANATIVCGNTIGKYAFIGAGAVVTKDVSDYALMVGNPAFQLGWMCSCGATLSFVEEKAICQACNRKYYKIKDKIEEDVK